MLAANFADKIVSVEVQTKYNGVLAYNMEINGFANYSVENVFVGEGGYFSGLKDTVTLEEIMNDNDLESIDFLKIDIEGSEFKLFSELNCLNKIRYISMEVHREHGNPQQLIDKLTKNGFQVVLCNSKIEKTQNIDQVNFLYASRT